MDKVKTAILWLLWPAYVREGNCHAFGIVLKFWIIQKVLRINSRVPWPVDPTSRVMCPENIDRGSRTPGMAKGCHIDGRNGIIFGENVWVGPRVSIISMNHNIHAFDEYVTCKPVRIGRDSWLATNCVILPGVELGPHTIVAAGAIVSRSYPEGNVVLGGVPATPIREIEPYDKTLRT